MRKNKGRPRRVPQRTCVACRARESKRSLIRLVRTPDGQIEVDPSGRRPGRGAYLCANRACWEQALKRRALNRALRVVLTPAEMAQLQQIAHSLPLDEETTPAEASSTASS